MPNNNHTTKTHLPSFTLENLPHLHAARNTSLRFSSHSPTTAHCSKQSFPPEILFAVARIFCILAA